MAVRGEIFSTKIVLDKRSYFFNVKENRLGDLFLNIVESKKSEEGEGFERHAIVLFSDDVKPFLEGFEESLSYIEKELARKGKAARLSRPAKRPRDDEREPRGDDDRPRAKPRAYGARDGEGDGPRKPRAYGARDGARDGGHGEGERPRKPRAYEARGHEGGDRDKPRARFSRDGGRDEGGPRGGHEDRRDGEGFPARRATRAAPRKDARDSAANPPPFEPRGARAGYADRKGMGPKPRAKLIKGKAAGAKGKAPGAKAPRSLVKKVVRAKKREEE